MELKNKTIEAWNEYCDYLMNNGGFSQGHYIKWCIENEKEFYSTVSGSLEKYVRIGDTVETIYEKRVDENGIPYL